MAKPEGEPVKYNHHTECRMIVVVGAWADESTVVIGAVEETAYAAFLEEGRWNERKGKMLVDSGFDDVPQATLREVLVTTWMPYLWEIPEIVAEETTPMEPEE